jgi:hypothetical protein
MMLLTQKTQSCTVTLINPEDPPTKRFLRQWKAKIDEVVEKYEPDLT